MLGGPAAVVRRRGRDRLVRRRPRGGAELLLGLRELGRADLRQPRPTLLALTPLLGAGNRRHVEHWMYGRLPGGLDRRHRPARVGAGRARLGRRRASVKERNRFTICAVDLDASLPLFRGVYLHPRRGAVRALLRLAGRARRCGRSRWRARSSCERYELRIAERPGRDRCCAGCCRRRWSAGWRTTRLCPGFELKAGTLCVFVPRPLEDAGNLTYLIDATVHLAGRVRARSSEEQARAA